MLHGHIDGLWMYAHSTAAEALGSMGLKPHTCRGLFADDSHSLLCGSQNLGCWAPDCGKKIFIVSYGEGRKMGVFLVALTSAKVVLSTNSKSPDYLPYGHSEDMKA